MPSWSETGLALILFNVSQPRSNCRITRQQRREGMIRRFDESVEVPIAVALAQQLHS